MNIFESFLEKYIKEDKSDANYDAKDEKRILDIITKSYGNKNKAQQLAQNMANKITDASKALRRANAAEDHNYHDLAEIFYKRYNELDKGNLRKKMSLFDSQKETLNESIKFKKDRSFGKTTIYQATDGNITIEFEVEAIKDKVGTLLMVTAPEVGYFEEYSMFDVKDKIKDAFNKKLFENEIQQIANLTGTRVNAVETFLLDNNLDVKKISTYLSKGKLVDRMNFASALSGKPNNKYQKDLIKNFSLNEDVAVRGDVGGVGNYTFPSTTTNGSGDSFGGITTNSIIPSTTLGNSYDKIEMINAIVSKDDSFSHADLETKTQAEIKELYDEVVNESASNAEIKEVHKILTKAMKVNDVDYGWLFKQTLIRTLHEANFHDEANLIEHTLHIGIEPNNISDFKKVIHDLGGDIAEVCDWDIINISDVFSYTASKLFDNKIKKQIEDILV
jgi:hypothetical protein